MKFIDIVIILLIFTIAAVIHLDPSAGKIPNDLRILTLLLFMVAGWFSMCLERLEEREGKK